ncbi:MAG: SDR family oxidoreductase [Microbacteriaceae bacterium]|nr:MAG: SDR family oxidoreductase [Microbacteriaceae bacterium]
MPEDRASTAYPLLGRSALVTGVSRRRGIGYAIAVRLAELGANVFVHHFSAHDATQPWGADDLDAVRDGIRSAQHPDALFGDLSADMADPAAPGRVIDAAVSAVGRLRILVCNHARGGGDGSIFDMTAERLDAHWQVNTRSTVLLTRRFAAQFSGETVREEATQPGVRQVSVGPFDEFATGRVIWLTSGQLLGPMPGEVAYAGSKAALAGLTVTVASELLTRGIILNTVNPGPVNTGYLDPDSSDRPAGIIEEHLRSMPFGRFGAPDDPARLIGWLVSDDGRWVVGQVLTSDGGFSL